MGIVAGLVVAQAVLVGAAVAPRLSARLTGEEYAMRVAPIDPIDPFRGAYVTLDYPDLRPDRPGRLGRSDPLRADGIPAGEVFVSLVRDGETWVAADYLPQAPASGPFIRCEYDGWSLSCGIESWFADQREALRLEREVADGAVATVRVDSRGNAAIVDLR
jgi:uncharacterized membrane-anchored protein